jgi:hypothetical protein
MMKWNEDFKIKVETKAKNINDQWIIALRVPLNPGEASRFVNQGFYKQLDKVQLHPRSR